ncbi:unnamed protein product [Parajaminaea phylloscopi]
MTGAQASEVHPRQGLSPALPATAIDDAHSDELHDPRWAKQVRIARPNLWARTRFVYREPLAEFLGTAFILLFGASVECQVNLHYDLFGHPQSAGDFNSQRLAWACGVALGVWIAGNSSGAHLNPSVTVALWFFRGFPGSKVVTYIIAQIAGAAFGAALTYSNYFVSITAREGGKGRTVTGPRATAGLFVTSPQSWLPWTSAAWSEMLASAALVCTVFALSDKKNLSVPKGIMPFAMFITLVGIGASMGLNTGYAINFARDFGPRLFLSLMGYPREIFTHNNYWTFWGPGISSVLGGLLGGLTYDIFVYTGADSPVNRPEGPRRPNAASLLETATEGSAILDEDDDDLEPTPRRRP